MFIYVVMVNMIIFMNIIYEKKKKVNDRFI